MTDTDTPRGHAGLAALEARLRQDLAWLELPAKAWTMPRTHQGQAVLDVAVIGGGMAGLAVSATLKHLGIQACAFDQSPAGFEGPWATTARMETLRSPKQLTGPALGLPALTFRAWFEAQYGDDAWEAWTRSRVCSGWTTCAGTGRCSTSISATDTASSRYCRAPTASLRCRWRRRTGRAPCWPAAWYSRPAVTPWRRYVPPLADGLPRKLWAHSSDAMDYTSLRGKRVGVVGAGASAMDSAATALEAGAASVDMLIRRADIPRVNKSKGAGNPGLTYGHHGLTDEWKWRLRHYINSQQVPPPRGSTLRVSRHAKARFNLGCAIEAIDVDGDLLRVRTSKGVFELDFLIFSTGFRIALETRPEFAAFAPHARFWRDRYAPRPGLEDLELSDSPDLGPAFEFQEKAPGACPGLSRIHAFCYPAALSHGTVSGDIPAISEGAKRLGQGIAALLYQEDVELHYAALQAYAEPEVFGDEWVPAPPPALKS